MLILLVRAYRVGAAAAAAVIFRIFASFEFFFCFQAFHGNEDINANNKVISI